QVGAAVRTGDAPAPRLRRPGARALQRPSGAVFATGGGEQLGGGQSDPGFPDFSPAAPAGAAAGETCRTAPDPDDAEKPAPPSSNRLAPDGFDGGTVSTRDRTAGMGESGRPRGAAAPCERESRRGVGREVGGRTSRGADASRAGGTAVSVSGGGDPPGGAAFSPRSEERRVGKEGRSRAAGKRERTTY